MKFYIRRAVAGIILTPVVAGLYTLGYALLVIAGGNPGMNLTSTLATGVQVGVVVSLMLILAPQVSRLIDKMEA
jgi:hypothetical protein